MDIGPPEWIVIGLILLVVFGSSKIPQLARNLGRAQSELRKGFSEGRGEDDSCRADEHAPDGGVSPETASSELRHGVDDQLEEHLLTVELGDAVLRRWESGVSLSSGSIAVERVPD